MIFLQNQHKLYFDEPSHTYTFEGQNLVSISSLLKNYGQPFDSDGIIVARKAAENGITVKEQKEIWEKIGKDSRDKGTAFHADAEYYIKTKKIPNTINKTLIKQFSKIKFKGVLFSEIRLFCLEYGIAGTTDIIEVLRDGSLGIWDFKTNAAKKMTRFSFGKKMKYPLNHIWDSVIDKYELQISAYAFMLECAGWWINDLTLLHIDTDKQQIKKIPMKNRRNDVINMLEHYRQNKINLQNT